MNTPHRTSLRVFAGLWAGLWMSAALAPAAAEAPNGAAGRRESAFARPAPAASEAEPVSGSGWNLFNPTPANLMREFQTDRPDRTESPYTIDAGHFAIESGLFEYTRNDLRPGDTSRPEQRIVVLNTAYKLGLFNNVDLQLFVESFVWQRMQNRSGHGYAEESGVGATTVRLKWNLWGNDAGKTALAFMPYVIAPTSELTDDIGDVEGGLIIPFAVKAPFGWNIGTMTQVEVRHNVAGGGYHPAWINSIAFHHTLFTDRLDGYVEFYSDYDFEGHGAWAATVDLGLQYKLTENLLLDGGVNIGVTRDADDVNPFLGLSVRF